MKLLGTLLLACVVLAAIRATIAALFIAFAVALLWLACTLPRETLGFVAACAVGSLIQNHGLAFLAIVGLALIVKLVRPNQSSCSGGDPDA